MLSGCYGSKILEESLEGRLVSHNLEGYADCFGSFGAQDVVSLLWQNHHVPEWIDISVWGVSEQTTYFKLICCGRSKEDQDKFYYTWDSYNGQTVAPFGVKGPPYRNSLALQVVKGRNIEKFSLFDSQADFPLK